MGTRQKVPSPRRTETLQSRGKKRDGERGRGEGLSDDLAARSPSGEPTVETPGESLSWESNLALAIDPCGDWMQVRARPSPLPLSPSRIRRRDGPVSVRRGEGTFAQKAALTRQVHQKHPMSKRVRGTCAFSPAHAGGEGARRQDSPKHGKGRTTQPVSSPQQTARERSSPAPNDSLSSDVATSPALPFPRGNPAAAIH